MNYVRNTFAGNPLDRAGDRRADEEWIRGRMDEPGATFVAFRDGMPLVRTTSRGGTRSLANVPPSVAKAAAAARGRALFLGLWAGAPVFAVEIEGDPETPGSFEELRSVALTVMPDEAAIAATAKSLFDWHRRHQFCSACGAPTAQKSGGWLRACSSCSAEHFPRVDPVVIMLPVFGQRCLLARQPSWPAGRMAPLAGFVEPGESIEEACAREIREEAGLVAARVLYHSSQPWPFPSSLMIGLIAVVETDAVSLDSDEIEEARWLTREEARAVLDGTHPDLKPPTRLAIGHRLLEAWARERDRPEAGL
jgi:NAD+ diphosphatase